MLHILMADPIAGRNASFRSQVAGNPRDSAPFTGAGTFVLTRYWVGPGDGKLVPRGVAAPAARVI